MAQISLSVYLNKHYNSMLYARKRSEMLAKALQETKLRSAVHSPKFDSPRTSSGNIRGGVEQTAIRIVDLESEIAGLHWQEVYEQALLHIAAYAVEDHRMRVILILRYADGMSWEDMSQWLDEQDSEIRRSIPKDYLNDPNSPYALKKCFQRHQHDLDEITVEEDERGIISIVSE